MDKSDAQEIKQHSITKSVLLHLVPGILNLLLFMLLAPIVKSYGFPVIMGNFLVVLLAIVPFQLGFLMIQVRKKSVRFSLKPIVPFTHKIPRWQYVVLVPCLIFWAALIFSLLAPLDQFLIDQWFFFMPDWFLTANENFSQYSKPALIITWITGIILNGIVAPVTEELYFRGYLLPRIGRLGKGSVVVNTVLFSLYHFFSPWQNLERILGLLPMVYTVYAKRNIYISIFTHITVNTVSSIMLFNLFFI